MTASTVVAGLFAKMEALVPCDLYPSEVLPIQQAKIVGTAFFPCGSGLYLGDRHLKDIPFPFGGVMVLGHNFASELGFQHSLERGKENLTSGTWKTMIALLAAANIPLHECFFTNAFMGLCRGKNSFDYRGRQDQPFRAACLSFLRTQIRSQSPRLILTLGLQVPPLLADISADLASWSMSSLHLDDIDQAPIFFRAAITLDDGSSYKANIVALAHPCLPNNAQRRPKGFPEGRLGEVEMIKAGWTTGV